MTKLHYATPTLPCALWFFSLASIATVFVLGFNAPNVHIALFLSIMSLITYYFLKFLTEGRLGPVPSHSVVTVIIVALAVTPLPPQFTERVLVDYHRLAEFIHLNAVLDHEWVLFVTEWIREHIPTYNILALLCPVAIVLIVRLFLVIMYSKVQGK